MRGRSREVALLRAHPAQSNTEAKARGRIVEGMRARAGLRRGRFMAGSRAAERGFDSNYEAASQVLIKREPREGGPETPRPKIKVGGRGGQAPGPTPRPAPAQRGKAVTGGRAEQTLGARAGALAPSKSGTQCPCPVGP